jgi:nucleoid-associated protein YgaU
MSLRRLALTVAFMGVAGLVLAALTPAVEEMTAALAAPQRTADTLGPDSLVIAAAGLLAWSVWAWGVLGLVLTAASAVPGMVGSAARLATHVVLPAGARRSAALLLGLGLGVGAPLAGVAATVLAPSAVAAVPADGVPDWPVVAPAGGPAPDAPDAGPARGPVPDWPAPGPAAGPLPDRPDTSTAPAGAAHVVVRGDCLWHIAAAHLLARSGAPPSDGDIARAVHDWWTTNADVIGPDPDHLLPGQVLRVPGTA